MVELRGVHMIQSRPHNLNRKYVKILFELHNDSSFQVFKSYSNGIFFFTLCPRRGGRIWRGVHLTVLIHVYINQCRCTRERWFLMVNLYVLVHPLGVWNVLWTGIESCYIKNTILFLSNVEVWICLTYPLSEDYMDNIGGSRGGRARRAPPPTGPDSFVLTCKIFET